VKAWLVRKRRSNMDFFNLENWGGDEFDEIDPEFYDK